jgi:hypothetical protein
MDRNNRELPGRRLLRAIAAELSDRTRKHEYHSEAKKEFTDDFCFHVIYFFLVLAFFDFSSLRTHLWPFTEAVRKIRREVTRKASE